MPTVEEGVVQLTARLGQEDARAAGFRVSETAMSHLRLTCRPEQDDPAEEVEAAVGKEPSKLLLDANAIADRCQKVIREAAGEPMVPAAWLESAAEIGILSAELRKKTSDVRKALGIKSARVAILLYLRQHVGESVPGDAIAGVAGISDWARRVRELRVEFGWPIESGVNTDGMSIDHYRLTADEPDPDLAERWQVAKGARNLKKTGGKMASAKDRLIHYLQAVSPRVADKEQLSHVANINEWPRRLRELEEEGWRIDSNIDDPSLPPGSYRLSTLERRPARVREAIKLRYAVLERDGKTCQDCGRTPGQGAALQIHHIQPVHVGGGNEEGNLVTLCSQCHAGRHAHMSGPVKDELLNPEYDPALAAEQGRFKVSAGGEPAGSDGQCAGTGPPRTQRSSGWTG
ncbi:HNH endonuclease [Streptacidiphilus sp. MAP12-16]|uniref:HNH endonuclease n=1 Tax=Streptacidiphilus sp. MAP12-16 TaxID=3156300 RepID=UPI003518A927